LTESGKRVYSDKVKEKGKLGAYEIQRLQQLLFTGVRGETI